MLACLQVFGGAGLQERHAACGRGSHDGFSLPYGMYARCSVVALSEKHHACHQMLLVSHSLEPIQVLFHSTS